MYFSVIKQHCRRLYGSFKIEVQDLHIEKAGKCFEIILFFDSSGVFDRADVASILYRSVELNSVDGLQLRHYVDKLNNGAACQPTCPQL